MNPKIEKLKAERSRNIEKISDLQNRNRKTDGRKRSSRIRQTATAFISSAEIRNWQSFVL